MENFRSRTEAVFGKDGVGKLKNASVAVFGIGGVGSYTVEALARAGVGKITVVDGDTVSVSNINRQLIALNSTVGRKKTEVAKERIKDINPECEVDGRHLFFSSDTVSDFDFSSFDAVVDAVDSVPAKVLLAKKCEEGGTFIISSMGTGNKTEPTLLKVADVYKTKVCPLARKMRTELKKAGVEKLLCVYSEELPVKNGEENNVLGSNSFVPASAGLLLASETVKYLINRD